MTPDRESDVERICHEALALDVAARDAFVADACAGDDALRREVESLLRQQSKADGFLAEPALVAAAHGLASESGHSLIGRTLGTYRIHSLLGAGGMGEVYRARDTKLGRDVAIKILPRIFVTDPERLARFEREARMLASLNHPNIGAIYGVEDVDGTPALVLELVEGPTLADRMANGPLPVHDALTIAAQIALALEAAHDRGIVHRDLKPANIKITPDGIVKVLDFGLAKATASGAAAAVTQSPTVTVGGTHNGVILGTAPYMSPEQAQGQAADARSDIWAFGVVLYEMLTGKPGFGGKTTLEVLSNVLKAEPDWTALPAATPSVLRSLLRRCVQKEPNRRLRDIADARFQIEEALTEPASAATVSVPPPAQRTRERLLWAAALVVLLAAIGLPTFMYVGRAPVETRVYRASILPPGSLSGFASTRMALSPDGRRLAFVVTEASGRTLLWVRALDSLVAQPLSGTEGAAGPFWSPDGRSLGFFADEKLKRISASGGPTSTLCDATFKAPGSWNRDDVILFTPGRGAALSRVSANGGMPSPATVLDTKAGETTHSFPFFLPDGRHFLYLAQASGGTPQGVFVASLDSTDRTRLLEGGSNAQYAQGFLLFLRGTTLMAQPFDVTRLALAGEAVPLAEQVQVSFSPATGFGRSGAFAISDTGVLAYQAGSAVSQLVWFDRAGHQTATLGDRADYADLFLSPDAKQASVSVAEPGATSRDIWTFDVERSIRTRFTFAPDEGREAPWSFDGSRRAFNLSRKGHLDLYQKSTSGAGSEELLFADGRDKYPMSWSPDGQSLLYVTNDDATVQDLWVLPLSGDRKPYPFLRTKFGEGTGQFSPDGRWMAYRSDESGRLEVYVAPFPGPGARVPISIAGGNFPRWRRDGKEIFYLAPDNKLMAAPVSIDGARVDVGAVRSLFDVRPGARWFYDVSADGQRFLVNMGDAEQTASAPITLVVNWAAGLRK